MAHTDYTATVTADLSGSRLDNALELIFPSASLRERRRVWENYAVIVDGKARPKGFRVREGQQVILCALDAKPDAGGISRVPEGLRVVAQNTGYMAALFKPAGLHSQAIAGRKTQSIEAYLPVFWPNHYAKLVNRLDQLTSGLVLVALSPEAEEAYRYSEDAAQVRKTYLAVVDGILEQEVVVQKKLDMARRRKVRILDEIDPSPVRRTVIKPLGQVAERQTLVMAEIQKGARHQIRAHCASLGYPIVGDPLYGRGGEVGLYLHHYRLSMPEFQAQADPQWEMWEKWRELMSVDSER